MDIVKCDCCGSSRPSVKSLRRHLLSQHGRIYSVRAGVSAPFPGSLAELRQAQLHLARDRMNPRMRREYRATTSTPASGRVPSSRDNEVPISRGRGRARIRSTWASGPGTRSDGPTHRPVAVDDRLPSADRRRRATEPAPGPGRRAASPSPSRLRRRDGSSGRRVGRVSPSRSPAADAPSRPTAHPAGPPLSSSWASGAAAATSGASAAMGRPAGIESSSSADDTLLSDLSDGAVIHDLLEELYRESHWGATPTSSPPRAAPRASSTPDSATRPPQVDMGHSASMTEPPPIVLGTPLDVCPIPVCEIAAAVDAQPQLSAAQIVALITGRVRLDDRARALLVAAVDGAVACHRYQAERFAQQINTARQDPSWLPLLGQHPMLYQLSEIIRGRLNSALSRPF